MILACWLPLQQLWRCPKRLTLSTFSNQVFAAHDDDLESMVKILPVLIKGQDWSPIITRCPSFTPINRSGFRALRGKKEKCKLSKKTSLFQHCSSSLPLFQPSSLSWIPASSASTPWLTATHHPSNFFFSPATGVILPTPASSFLLNHINLHHPHAKPLIHSSYTPSCQVTFFSLPSPLWIFSCFYHLHVEHEFTFCNRIIHMVTGLG